MEYGLFIMMPIMSERAESRTGKYQQQLEEAIGRYSLRAPKQTEIAGEQRLDTLISSMIHQVRRTRIPGWMVEVKKQSGSFDEDKLSIVLLDEGEVRLLERETRTDTVADSLKTLRKAHQSLSRAVRLSFDRCYLDEDPGAPDEHSRLVIAQADDESAELVKAERLLIGEGLSDFDADAVPPELVIAKVNIAQGAGAIAYDLLEVTDTILARGPITASFGPVGRVVEIQPE